MNARAFTLLELITVSSLVIILGTIAVVGWGAIRDSMSVHAAAHQVAMELSLARIRAINKYSNHAVRFEVGSGTYRTQRWDGKKYVDTAASLTLPNRAKIASCTAPEAAVVFRPRGNASSFGTISIVNRRGATRNVIVDIAGRVRIE